MVPDFPNKEFKRLYSNLNFISHFIRNTSDLKLKMLFLICGTPLYSYCFQASLKTAFKVPQRSNKFIGCKNARL